jgi:hypothetical protein
MLASVLSLMLGLMQLSMLDGTMNRFPPCQIGVYPTMGQKLRQANLIVNLDGSVQGRNGWQADDIDEDDDEEDYV